MPKTNNLSLSLNFAIKHKLKIVRMDCNKKTLETFIKLTHNQYIDALIVTYTHRIYS